MYNVLCTLVNLNVFIINDCKFVVCKCNMRNHAGHTRKASRISKTVVENCGKGVGNFYLS